MRPLLLFAEPFAGSAALSRALLGGITRSRGGGERPILSAPVVWPGGKGRLSAALLRVLGLEPGQGAENLVLNDACEAWPLLWRMVLDGDVDQVIEQLRAWQDEDLPELWASLRSAGRPEDEATRLLFWLLLQAHAAAPVWWEGERLVQGAVTRLRGGRSGLRSIRSPGRRCPNGDVGWDVRLRPEQIARRLELLARAVRRRQEEGMALTVTRSPAEDCVRSLLDWLAEDRSRDPGRVVVYLDPPGGGTGFEADVTRASIREMAESLNAAGVVVLVSEFRGLSTSEGWNRLELAGAVGQDRPEWITLNRPLAWRPPEQLALFPKPANDPIFDGEPTPPRRPQLTLHFGGDRPRETRVYA